MVNSNISANNGAGISNTGTLTVSASTVSGKIGGGIFNNGGTITVDSSTLSGNSAGDGGGIANAYSGTATVTNSTISGNSASNFGGGIENDTFGGTVTLTLIGTTISGNSGDGIHIGTSPGSATITVMNSIVAGNTTNGTEDDCDVDFGLGCPGNGSGNVVGVPPLLAPLGNYGGPTQTMPPLPGSPAICAGLIADIPAGVTTDQRGLPRTTTYGSNPPCIDSGAVQTHYALAFNTEPPAIVAPNANSPPRCNSARAEIPSPSAESPPR